MSVVVPTYNESENVGNLTNQIDYALRGIDYEVIFVDDSTDNTPDAIKKVIEENPNVRMEHRETEKGLATAVLEGFKLSRGDYIAVMDADLQHPPAILRSMYAVMETGVDFCVPSRFIPGGSDGGLGPYRKLVSGVARYIGKIMLPSLRKITDPTSGLFMFRRSVIEDADLRPIGWKIMVEVLAMGNYRSVVEIPYKFQARPAGESKLSSKVTLEYLKQVAELTRRGKKQSDVTVTRWSVSKLKSELEKIG
ncbi:MAG: polyprenol monophosphomannose synthase [Lachnospiraceae bacterium]|nr:polyprenol monophosphomannose synthase [Lachnospiraceae bacterium]MBQ8665860.1 polyprenol monophosphomannose synthase [Lachnospiraceae bacterium]MBR1450393.1 polyprenol monophosphomannose synthase [Lachnospiraceae bacterium]